MNRRRALSASTMSGSAEPIDINNYLTIVALQDGLTAQLSTNACEYCVDGDGNWKALPAATSTEVINTGQTLSFKGILAPRPNLGIGKFTISKSFNLEGNCMSMLFGDDAANNFSLSVKNYAFCELFINCDVVEISNDFLPATTLAPFCYYRMFKGCTSLTQAPLLPATTLESNCYQAMLEGCTSLTQAPLLPAIALVSYCYNRMFYGCSNLNYIKAMFTTTPSTSYTNNWVYSVASTGKFIKNGKATWNVTGVHGVPSGWSIQSAAE